jgi:hypothetical protein
VSVFDSNFAAAQAKVLLDQHGETVIYTPLGGSPRNVKAIVNRNPPEPLPGVPNTQGKFILVTVIETEPLLAISDDGYGGIESATVNTGGDTITVADRMHATATARPVKKVVSQAGGMMTLEVR